MRKQSRPQVRSTAEMARRIQRAGREGRFQHGLELAHQLFQTDPSPAHRDLLVDMSLARCRQLREQGSLASARELLQAVLQKGDLPPDRLEPLALEMARCGLLDQALAMAGQLPDPATAAILAHAADTALTQEGAVRALPESLRADYQRIVQAFEQVEAGEDEAARLTMQDIGLRSPFLEWKLLLRGLQAYYRHDDGRALENWQRLSADRLPARLAAPYRFLIDPAYRQAQPGETQTQLQQDLDRLQGLPMLTQLRALRKTMADRQALPTAFRQAEVLLPRLRQEAPHLVAPLARCFYWATMETGPDDVLRLRRVFGALPEDPRFHRLQALAHERAGNLAEAHKFWQLYEKDIQGHPAAWPGDQACKARALLWLHMGQNAATIPDRPRKGRRPNLFFDEEEQRPLKPSPAECFARSLELVPDQLDPWFGLFLYHLANGRQGQAEKAGRQLLERFPDHLPTLLALSDLYRRSGKAGQALELAERAFKHNPLDRQLRARVSEGYLAMAQAHAAGARFEEARQAFQAALDRSTPSTSSDLLCCWWACEAKAGDSARAEALLTQARAQSPSELGLTFLMLVQCICLKLDRAVKAELDQQLKKGFAARPTPEAAVHLAQVLARLQSQGLTYVGQKTHVTRAMAYINKARTAKFSESQLEDLCAALWQMEMHSRLAPFARSGARQWQNNPHFPLYEALALLSTDDSVYHTLQVSHLLAEAQRRAGNKPAQPELFDSLRQQVLDRMEEAEIFPGGADFMQDMFERLFGFEDDDGCP